jgi:N utilization substance protein A
MVVDKLIALGIISVADLEDVGVEPLVKELGIKGELAEKLTAAAEGEAKRLAAEQKPNQAENLLKQQSGTTDLNNKE